ncbi:substrate-binding domain-containing protein [Undibacterium sp. Di26W]|uniref:vWA domain-containing protein n=1 Tax=Undibacterium sp. Di26W TaxID=3413035 RepID=UPI003BF37FB9
MRLLAKWLTLLLIFSLAACKDAKHNQPDAALAATTLTVMAGSELKDIEPLLPSISKATGIQLQLQYTGTLEAVEKLQSGEQIDLAWLASNKYAMLVPAARARILASERTMLTPVVLGLKESKAKALGWKDNSQVTWKDIAEAAKQGKFTFGMTSPSSSNTGFSGLLGLAAALSGQGDALEEKDINAKRLSAFFQAQRLTAGSSGWLAEAYLREQDKVDGIINYASTLQTLNRNTALKEKLVLVYPQDGIVTADYPIMLINPAKREAYDKVVSYLRGTEFQQAMYSSTLRHPVNPDVAVTDAPKQALAELSFPAKLAVVDAILTAFDNHLRLPTDSTFVLDTSGSMKGDRIRDLKAAMQGLSGADTSISGRFSRFRNRERIIILPFNNSVESSQRFDMGSEDKANQATLAAVAARIQQLRADGGTAIFSATQLAYTEAVERKRNDPARFYSIIVMTDGINNDGMDYKQFAQWYKALPDNEKDIKIFTVLFGEAEPDELKNLADLSGGRMFDSRKASLQTIFKEIRGYQ